MRQTRGGKFRFYFSATSPKNAQKRSQYFEILQIIKKQGGLISYNWLEDKVVLNPDQIYDKSLKGIKGADLLVAEISSPSTAVGQQISLAISWKIPVIVLYKKDNIRISRFTLGMESSYLYTYKYTQSELTEILKKGIERALKKKFVKFNFIATKDISGFLEKDSNARNISKSELLREIVRAWIKSKQK
jgi:hypothetical protein